MSDRAKPGHPHCFQRQENQIMMQALTLMQSDSPNSAHELRKILEASYIDKERNIKAAKGENQ